MQWKGKEDSVSGVQGADYVTVLLPPRKFLILLIIQEDLANSQKWAATLIKKGSPFLSAEPALSHTHRAHPQEQMSRLHPCCQGNQSVLSSRFEVWVWSQCLLPTSSGGPAISSHSGHPFTKSLALGGRVGGSINCPNQSTGDVQAHVNKYVGKNEFIHMEGADN